MSIRIRIITESSESDSDSVETNHWFMIRINFRLCSSEFRLSFSIRSHRSTIHPITEPRLKNNDNKYSLIVLILLPKFQQIIKVSSFSTHSTSTSAKSPRRPSLRTSINFPKTPLRDTYTLCLTQGRCVMYRPFLKLEEGNLTAREPCGPMRVRQIHNFLGKHRQIERKFNSNESSDPSNQELLSLCHLSQ